MSRLPSLVLAYLYRVGSTPSLRDGKLIIANPQNLDEYDRSMVQHHRDELVELLKRGGNRDLAIKWDPRVDTEEHRRRALPRGEG